MDTILGKKVAQTQKFLENGMRIPVTEVSVSGNPVVQVKSMDKDGYIAVQLGFGTRKKTTKALLGHIEGARLQTAPRFLREVRFMQDNALPELGALLKATDVLKVGDIVDVIGTSKGKGYAGVVKRYHFKGGPRTHGQSDRERAPGSIGQTTTPGRVYKGKRMSGRMGQDRVTIQNLQIVAVTEDAVFIKGLIPGSINSIVKIVKKGEASKFVPLYQEKVKEATNTNAEAEQTTPEEQPEAVIVSEQLQEAVEVSVPAEDTQTLPEAQDTNEAEPTQEEKKEGEENGK